MESGKDEVASILCRNHNYVRLSIGQFIREEVSRAINPIGVFVPDVVMETIHCMKRPYWKHKLWEKPTEPKIRETLQWWGRYRRSQDAQYWNKMLLRDMEERDREGHTKGVLSDMRMPAEFHLIQEHGEAWKIERAACLGSMKYGDLHKHETEGAIRNYPFKMILANNGSLNELETLVNMVVRFYGL